MDSDELNIFLERVLKQLLSIVARLSQKVNTRRSKSLLLSLQKLNSGLVKIYMCVVCPSANTAATTRDVKKILDDLEALCAVCLCNSRMWPLF
jgi:hypothetical protein